jgi:hypothetical protein
MHRRQGQTLLNSKSEMNHPPVAQITVEKKNSRAHPNFVSDQTNSISFLYRKMSLHPHLMANSQLSTSSQQ